MATYDEYKGSMDHTEKAHSLRPEANLETAAERGHAVTDEHGEPL